MTFKNQSCSQWINFKANTSPRLSQQGLLVCVHIFLNYIHAAHFPLLFLFLTGRFYFLELVSEVPTANC